jgi:hypothetical protein
MEALLFVGSVNSNKITFGKLSYFNRSDFKQQSTTKTMHPARLNGFRLINMQLLRIFNQLFVSSNNDTSVSVENVLFVVPIRERVTLL